MNKFEYVGSELELFAAATNWKGYFKSRLAPYLGKRVLEVGAGFGGTTRLLIEPDCEHWLCLEPDAALAERIERSIASGELPHCCALQAGTVADVPAERQFDAILYIDVLEHIEDDRAELQRAAERLTSDGHLLVLCPAHQWLFTPFDEAIGHYRRYTKSRYRSITPPELQVVRLEYLDSIGLFASLANRLLLKSSMPTAKQIALWDRAMVPISRRVDPCLLRSFGKSVLGVWRPTPQN